jgi:hypothetical protein
VAAATFVPPSRIAGAQGLAVGSFPKGVRVWTHAGDAARIFSGFPSRCGGGSLGLLIGRSRRSMR